MKKEISDSFSFTQSEYSSKKGTENFEFENFTNEFDSNGNVSTSDSTFSISNSNNSMEQYKWDIEDLGNPSELIILDIEQLFSKIYIL